MLGCSNKENGPESGVKICGVIRIPNGTWCFVQMGVVIRDENCILHLFLPDTPPIVVSFHERL